jgi:hypothetical protein
MCGLSWCWTSPQNDELVRKRVVPSYFSLMLDQISSKSQTSTKKGWTSPKKGGAMLLESSLVDLPPL